MITVRYMEDSKKFSFEYNVKLGSNDHGYNVFTL